MLEKNVFINPVMFQSVDFPKKSAHTSVLLYKLAPTSFTQSLTLLYVVVNISSHFTDGWRMLREFIQSNCKDAFTENWHQSRMLTDCLYLLQQ